MFQPKLFTLDDYNKMNQDFDFIKTIGNDELVIIDNLVLHSIKNKFGINGEKEIIRMVDRSQIFQSQAEEVLGNDKYREIGKVISCEWY